METVLSVTDCRFSYGQSAFCVEGITLCVHRGEMLGIVGPNGSGKSTLLRLMAGIVRPARGEIEIGGNPLESFRRRELACEVSFLPQGPTASFELSVREVVALGRYPYLGAFGLLSRHDETVIDRALHETDCAALSDRFFSTLSGGERQRVLVASILAQEPGMLLLDEPTASLDIHHKSAVFDLLRALSRKGMAVVVVTHDLNSASQFCDTLALLGDGRLVETGPPRQVMREDLLAGTYNVPLRVVEHPLTATPMVLILGGKANQNDEAPPDSD